MKAKPLSDPVPDTKTVLLDTAEKMFSREGIAESSLRAITSTAGVNLASVNYHFGSKDGLVRAVFARRLGPLNRQRLELLDRCLQHGSGVADLRCLLHAFVQPAVTMMKSRDPGDREFIKLMGRTLFEPSDELRSKMVAEFREVGERFTHELGRTLPDLGQEEIVWRFHFMVGSLARTVTAQYWVSHQAEWLNLPQEDDPTAITDRLVRFLASGWEGSPRLQREDGVR